MQKQTPNIDISTIIVTFKSRLAELNCRVTLTMDVLLPIWAKAAFKVYPKDSQQGNHKNTTR